MLVTVEQKAQNWRAIAVLKDGREALLFVGSSSTQVRSGWLESLKEYKEADREEIDSVKLQQWQGTPDAGKWIDRNPLRMPAPVGKKVAA